MGTSGLPLLVFGQGPVLDRISRVKAQDAETVPGGEDMNFWGHTLSLAGSILEPPQYIVMGGKTGGENYPSEAEIIEKMLVAYGVPSEVIKLEQTSTNTLENITNFMDLYLGEDSDLSFDLLGTNYHIERIELLMDLFGISWRHSFGSHDVIRGAIKGVVANSKLAAAVEEMSVLDIPISSEQEAASNFFERQLGVEQKTFCERAYEEDAFTRMLLEVPEYWMTYLGRIKHDFLLSKVLQNVAAIFPGYLESLGVDPTSSDPAAIEHARSVLGPIPRPNIAQWILDEMPTGWPAETVRKLGDIAERRRS